MILVVVVVVVGVVGIFVESSGTGLEYLVV